MESNSQLEIRLINHCGTEHNHCNTLWKIRELLNRDWECCLNHYCRKGNFYTDVLAEMSLDMHGDDTLLPSPSQEIRSYILADCRGVMYCHFVSS